MRRDSLVGSLVISAFLFASCGGGGDSGSNSGPFHPWPKFRRNNNNSAVGSSNLNNNRGVASLFYAVAPGIATTVSTPALAADDVIYLGTSDGLVALNSNSGDVRWHFQECRADGVNRPLGRIVSSPTVVADGKDVIVGAMGTDDTNGGVFRIGVDPIETPQCTWGFPKDGVPFSTRSSPVTIVDPNEFALLTLFIGTDAGQVIALTSDGLRRWSFPDNASLSGALSSSPAFSTLGIVLSVPDGRVFTLDETGRPLWSFSTGQATETELLPSVTTQEGVYAINRRTLFSINLNGTEGWRYQMSDEILGSPGVGILTIPLGEGGVAQETVVVAVDSSGILAGIVDFSGKPVRFCELENQTCVPSTCPNETTCFQVDRCSDSKNMPCTDDGDCPSGEECVRTGRCSEDPLSDDGFDCTMDTCLVNDDRGLCTREAILPISSEKEISVASSPALSPDGFVVVATTDGEVCARRLDGSVPGGQCGGSGGSCTPDSCGTTDLCCGESDPTCPTPGHCRDNPALSCTADTCPDPEGQPCESPWKGGCIPLPGISTRSSPVIDANGAIYVTTEEGLVKIE